MARALLIEASEVHLCIVKVVNCLQRFRLVMAVLPRWLGEHNAVGGCCLKIERKDIKVICERPILVWYVRLYIILFISIRIIAIGTLFNQPYDADIYTFLSQLNKCIISIVWTLLKVDTLTTRWPNKVHNSHSIVGLSGKLSMIIYENLNTPTPPAPCCPLVLLLCTSPCHMEAAHPH